MSKIHPDTIRQSSFIRRSSAVALSLMLGLGTCVTVPWALRQASADSPRSRERTTARPAPVRQSAVHNPYVKFQSGQEISDLSPDAEAAPVRSAAAQPLAMASSDFDEDGVPDLIVGLQHGTAGHLMLYRGSEAPQPAEDAATVREAIAEAPFLAASRTLEVPEAPALIAAGDFNADGYQDAITAAREGSALYLLAGNGQGDFAEAEKIVLSGQVTAMTSGEINRADGLTDVVVAVKNESRAQVLVFESPEGAARAQAEIIPVLAPVSSMSLAQLDHHYAMDLVMAAGRDLLIVKGRDRKLSQAEAAPESIAPAAVERLSFPAAIVSVTTGDFVWESDHRTEIALLTADHRARLLQRSNAPLRPSRHRRSDWSELPQTQQIAGKEILAANVSGLPTDELLVIDEENNQVQVLSGEAEKRFTEDSEVLLSSPAISQIAAAITADSAPVAVLPLRINHDALTDLVVLRENRSAPAVVLAATAAAFVVNSTADTNDGVCNAANCTLREAINAANASPGADTITFSLGPTLMQPVINLTSLLPVITDPVTINGSVGPFRVHLNGQGISNVIGSGLKVTAGSSTLTRLVISRFQTGSGVRLETNGGNVVTDCRLGINPNGTVAQGNGSSATLLDDANLAIQNSPNNTIGGTTTSARNIISGSVAGIIIAGSGATGNKVQGNRIGTDAAGNQALGNKIGVWNIAAPNNTIGGTLAGAGNQISGNGDAQSGIGVNLFPTFTGSLIGETTGTLVQGNLIGTNAAGTAALGNTTTGVNLADVTGNTIGGTTASARNIISGNGRNGITDLTNVGSQQNLIQGNFIGLNLSGTAALGNALNGIVAVGKTGGAIGGTVSGARNVISSNGANGVLLTTAEFLPTAAETEQAGGDPLIITPTTQLLIAGNFIGTDSAGTADLGNALNGIRIEESSSANTIGGSTNAARNIISGNSGSGIELDDAPGNFVQGNFIGADVNGTAALANGRGVNVLNGSSSNLIGGLATTTGAAPGNVISGNNAEGIRIFSESAASGNQIQGNLIGTRANGTAALANGGIGILIVSSANTVIGGTSTGARNVISGNNGNGIQTNGNGTLVQGNFIGTDISGNNALGNIIGVIALFGGDVTVGGTSASAGNVISGNRNQGISLQAEGCAVQGNRIGTNVAGTGALGNQGFGIHVNRSNNLIGGTVAGEGNIIAFNLLRGIVIGSSSSLIKNRINRNSIFSNGSLGIDLGDNVVTLNDTGDADIGPNNLQNFPVITEARTNGSISGSLNSTANTTFRIEFYVNDDCDASEHGEGQTFLIAVNLVTDASGNAAFSVNAGSLVLSKKITATATDPNGNTSEFSACRNVTQ